MRLLLDEDTQARALVRLLREAGQAVETVAEASTTGQPDPDVLAYAKQTSRILLTRNGRDFLLLHQTDPQHMGILVEHQDADPAKNMTYRQIATAIGKIDASEWSLQSQFISINAWR